MEASSTALSPAAVGRLEITVADAAHAFDDVDSDTIGRLSIAFTPQA
ncbi:hypothetical protein [Streptomyces sp. NPDC002994]